MAYDRSEVLSDSCLMLTCVKLQSRTCPQQPFPHRDGTHTHLCTPGSPCPSWLSGHVTPTLQAGPGDQGTWHLEHAGGCSQGGALSPVLGLVPKPLMHGAPTRERRDEGKRSDLCLTANTHEHLFPKPWVLFRLRMLSY